MELKITSEKVLDTIRKNPGCKNVLENLFPEIAEDNTIFCRTGQFLIDEKYPGNIYALIKESSKPMEYIYLLNISNGNIFQKKIRLHDLKDPFKEKVTVSEFKYIVGQRVFKPVKKVYLEF